QLGAAAHCSPAALGALAHWSQLHDAVSHPRQTVFLGVWAVLNALPMAQAERLCEAVTAWAGADRAGPASDHTLSAAELAQLDRGGLVEIGGHTVSHVPLDTADAATAAREIGQCRARLSDIVGRQIESFSYPFGRFGATTPALVRQAGFSRACTSTWQVAFPEVDPFQIPRVTIPDMDGDRFAAFLHKITGR
ncbi:MAG: polysaccharide deacetylase family protein, partial [Polymorphobacter sp.]